MFGYIIAVAVVFGVIMGARTALQAAAEGESVKDSRFVGGLAGTLCGVGALIALALFYAVCWAVWAYADWALHSSV